jgi:hypothetical protein
MLNTTRTLQDNGKKQDSVQNDNDGTSTWLKPGILERRRASGEAVLEALAQRFDGGEAAGGHLVWWR